MSKGCQMDEILKICLSELVAWASEIFPEKSQEPKQPENSCLRQKFFVRNFF